MSYFWITERKTKMHHSDKDIECIEKHKDELDVPGVLEALEWRNEMLESINRRYRWEPLFHVLRLVVLPLSMGFVTWLLFKAVCFLFGVAS